MALAIDAINRIVKFVLVKLLGHLAVRFPPYELDKN